MFTYQGGKLVACQTTTVFVLIEIETVKHEHNIDIFAACNYC